MGMPNVKPRSKSPAPTPVRPPNVETSTSDPRTVRNTNTNSGRESPPRGTSLSQPTTPTTSKYQQVLQWLKRMRKTTIVSTILAGVLAAVVMMAPTDPKKGGEPDPKVDLRFVPWNQGRFLLIGSDHPHWEEFLEQVESDILKGERIIQIVHFDTDTGMVHAVTHQCSEHHDHKYMPKGQADLFRTGPLAESHGHCGLKSVNVPLEWLNDMKIMGDDHHMYRSVYSVAVTGETPTRSDLTPEYEAAQNSELIYDHKSNKWL